MTQKTQRDTAPRRQSADPLERYDSPAWVGLALVEYGPLINASVIEPCAGAGALVEVFETAGGCRVAAFDVEPRAAYVDALDTLTPGVLRRLRLRYGADTMATNPPCSRAADLWREAYAAGFARIALLVRLSWLEKVVDRSDIPDPDGLIILPRPKFKGRKSDSLTVCWALWGDQVRRGIVRLPAEYRHKPMWGPSGD